jgi:hypothetical protein
MAFKDAARALADNGRQRIGYGLIRRTRRSLCPSQRACRSG